MSMSEETGRLIEGVTTNVAQVTSPFAERPVEQREYNVEVGAAREVAEVQAQMLIAHRLPRDEQRAMAKIINACTRPTLAQTALYSFSRGGTEITGPSIRLAEVMGQSWGNLKFGWREVQRAKPKRDPVTGRTDPGRSTVATYCTDLETNVTEERSFQVIHERSTKAGAYPLSDDRDIYEMIANQASRRVRACILAIIPGDVIETAVEQCETTMLAKADTSPEAVLKLVQAFEKFGVTREQIEQRIQRRLDTIRPAQIVMLRKTWKSLDDGMSVPGDWFAPKPAEPGQEAAPEPAKGNEGLKAKLRPQRPAPAASPPADDPQAEAATPASEPGTETGTPATGADTSANAGELPLREPGEEG